MRIKIIDYLKHLDVLFANVSIHNDAFLKTQANTLTKLKGEQDKSATVLRGGSM